MRTIFIEKDYWVTDVLKKLSTSKLVDEVILKEEHRFQKHMAA
jgi:hypothetical protein